MAGIDIRLPNITGATDREKLEQMRSYLVYLANQLQYVLTHVDESNLTEAFVRKVSADGGEESTFKQLAEGFSMVVKKNDVVSSINQTAEEIRILAKRLSLEGYTTINGNFKIDEEGNALLEGGSDIRLESADSNLAKVTVVSADGKRTVSISPSTVLLDHSEGGAITLNHLSPNYPAITVSTESGRVEIGGLYGITATAPLSNKTENAANLYMDEYGQLHTVEGLSAASAISTFGGRNSAPTELYDVDIKRFESGKGVKLGILSEDVAEIYPPATDSSGKANYSELVPALLALLQEQNERLKALEG